MTKIPPPSSPRVFPIGALALSNVIYAVPAEAEYCPKNQVHVDNVDQPTYACLDGLRLYAFTSLNQNNSEPVLSLAAHSEIVGEAAGTK
jgi:hypothetical protein